MVSVVQQIKTPNNEVDRVIVVGLAFTRLCSACPGRAYALVSPPPPPLTAANGSGLFHSEFLRGVCSLIIMCH